MGTKGGTKRIAALGPRTRPHSLITVVIETRLPPSPPVDPSHGAKMNGIFDSLKARGAIGVYECLCVCGGGFELLCDLMITCFWRFWLTAVPVCLYVCVGVCDIKCGVPRPFPPWTLGNRSFSGARINVRVWITFLDSGMTPNSKTGGWKRSLWFVHRHKTHKNNSNSISLWWMWPLVCAMSKSCDECVCFINLVQGRPKVPSL